MHQQAPMAADPDKKQVFRQYRQIGKYPPIGCVPANEPEEPRIPYGELPQEEQAVLQAALQAGKLEVNCPWWHRDHWELKSPHDTAGECATLWEDVYYRIVSDPVTPEPNTLVACPFCGDPMRINNAKLITHATRPTGCIIGDLVWDESNIERWNNRITHK